MNKLSSLSFWSKVLIGCYLIASLFALDIVLVLVLPASAKWLGILIAAALLAATYPIARRLESSLSDSISELTRVAGAIAKGDFTQKVPVTSSDALGELATSLNQMTDKLRGILTETMRISGSVYEVGSDIFQKNDDLRGVLEQVNVSAHELATGAGQISEEISEASQTTKDIEERISGYAQSTQQMSGKSDETLQLVEKGRRAVELQSEGTKTNVQVTAQIAETIDRLAEQAKGISTITHAISEIAEQTNLLSLNASIEAARAGEHGRGFAVVAQQVRKLAEESSTMTKEVFQLVRGIETGISATLQQMKINEQVVHKQSELIVETKGVFSQVVESVTYMAEEIRRFADESQSMLQSAKQIAASMENISAITEQSAASTEEMSASMNEQIAAVAEVVGKSEQMTRIAGELRKTVQIFKL
ncbi:methyl-accepting chemotaxis protein [Paenibacillus chartarius]|uniref:Methyl-accepting chemotaxis protein n=1 Tax=Paenibacillus chartarius TaxID=747481 RepID=A0ABV6DGQ2_9BACL